MSALKDLTPKQYIWALHKAAQKAAKTYQRFETECKDLTMIKLAFKVTHPEDFAEYEKLTKPEGETQIEKIEDHNKNGFIEAAHGQEVGPREAANEPAVVDSTGGVSESNDGGGT